MKKQPWLLHPIFWWIMFALVGFTLGKSVYDGHRIVELWSVFIILIGVGLQATAITMGRKKKDEGERPE